MRGFLRRLRDRLRPSGPRPVILLYHRVASSSIDPWGLAVRPDHFRQHVEVLKKFRTPLAMPEFVRRLQDKTLPDNAAAVTFDDGYLDNLREARPSLVTAHVPATVFLAAGAIGQAREFWWDEVARGILARREALDCVVALDGGTCRLTFEEASDDELRQNSSWRAWQEPRTNRQRTYLEFWRQLRDASNEEREAALDRFRRASNLSQPSASDLPMTAGDIAQLTRGGLIEIGGHTVTHPRLPLLEPQARRREIAEGKQRCESLAGRPVTGFAYPHGAEDEACRAAVRESGFAWACATANGFVLQTCDPFALPRLFVQDWDGEAFEAALA